MLQWTKGCSMDSYYSIQYSTLLDTKCYLISMIILETAEHPDNSLTVQPHKKLEFKIANSFWSVSMNFIHICYKYAIYKVNISQFNIAHGVRRMRNNDWLTSQLFSIRTAANKCLSWEYQHWNLSPPSSPCNNITRRRCPTYGTLYRWCTVVSVTFKYDKPKVENVAQGHSPSATFSTEGHHIWMSHKRSCFICFVVWPTASLKYDFLVNF